MPFCLFEVVDAARPDHKVCRVCGRPHETKTPAAFIKARCGGSLAPSPGSLPVVRLVLKLPPRPAKRFKPPPTAKQLASFLSAVKTFVSDGCRLVSKEDYERRLSICATCPERTGMSCDICGCALRAKARARAFHCPHPDGDKWRED
jgi:hypothetical protein